MRLQSKPFRLPRLDVALPLQMGVSNRAEIPSPIAWFVQALSTDPSLRSLFPLHSEDKGSFRNHVTMPQPIDPASFHPGRPADRIRSGCAVARWAVVARITPSKAAKAPALHAPDRYLLDLQSVLPKTDGSDKTGSTFQPTNKPNNIFKGGMINIWMMSNPNIGATITSTIRITGP